MDHRINMTCIDRAHHTMGASAVELNATPVLDPNYGGLEIMGQIAYYHLLLNRLQFANQGNGEAAWLIEEMDSIKTFIDSVPSTGLDPAMQQVLAQAVTNVNRTTLPATFNAWWTDTLDNMGGPRGPNIMDYLNNITSNHPFPSISGTPTTDNMKLPFGMEMLFVDLDRSGYSSSIDSYFATRDPNHPLSPPVFSTYGVSVIGAYLYTEWGSPSGNWSWSWISNLLDPTQKPLPTNPSIKNYTNAFFTDLNVMIANIESSGFTPAAIEAALNGFTNGFNNEFNN